MSEPAEHETERRHHKQRLEYGPAGAESRLLVADA